ncbi:MAG: DUF6489 family protein [Gammaproteobacteria bacterium]
MKINISIDATAEEMREFLGLPNIRPLQEEMLQAIRQNMQQGAAGFDPLSLMKPLFPAQMQSMEMLQKAFWEAFNTSETEKKPDKTGNKRTA